MSEVTNVGSCSVSEFSLRDRSVEVKNEARVDNNLSGRKIFRRGGKYSVRSGDLLSGRETLRQVGKYSVKSGNIPSNQRYCELND